MNKIKQALTVVGVSMMVTSAVPLSLAFGEPTGGANVCGVYTAAPSPSTSQNPNQTDGGQGNSDNKCPPGQEPGGNDNNNGYECDGNAGVGNGDPAHTENCPTPSVTATATPSVTPSATVSPTASPTATVSPTPSATPSVTASPTPSATVSATPSATPSATVSPTPSVSASPSATPSETPTVTPTSVPTTNPPIVVPPVKPLPVTGAGTDTLLVWSVIGMGTGGALLIAGLRKPA